MTVPQGIPEPTTSGAATVALRFEVTVIPVGDVDRRILQFTPPGSPASIQFGTGMTDMAPGTAKDMYLIVDDLEAARAELTRLGADVSEVWHGRGVNPSDDERKPGPDPDGNSYGSFASFEDPDGNRWLLQEIQQRLPGRV